MVFIGCTKKETWCTPVSPQAEEAQIIAYASANSISVVKNSSGIFYEIIDPGTGATPTRNSTVTTTYTGKLLNGTIFDSGTAESPLSGVIEGWQIGIPLIKKGGRIKLIIPSALAYGCNPVRKQNTEIVVIPANSVLYFDIVLDNVR
jgi:FKBP-type peptidyl-prolyl cis-trans isomerase FkpA